MFDFRAYIRMHCRSLKLVGVVRADGDYRINNSNISNTIRKAVFGRGPSCYKPQYQGKNWLAFKR